MILITGGHGFVGKALTRALIQKYPEIGLLTPTSEELNLLDYGEVKNYFEQNDIKCVFHLAARLGGVGVVSNKQLQFLEDNLLINFNTVHAARDSGVEKFITMGSSCSYSENSPLPNCEDQLWNGIPENTYGICKLVLLEHLANQEDMDWVYLIPPNIYGRDDHFGEENAHFIPATVMKFLDAIQHGESKIEVWGDGAQTRDFVYIDDMVHFLLEAYDNKLFSKNVLNIATAKEISIRYVVELIQEILGVSDTIKIKWAPDKPTGTKRKVLSNNKLIQICTGYSFVDIKDGLSLVLKDFTIKEKI